MNAEYVPLLLVYVAGALSISFLCSLLEATLLSVRVTALIKRAEEGDSGASVLLEIKQERVDDAISAILTLNTVAHTIGATLAGAQAIKVMEGSPYEDIAVGVFSGILTLAVLVVTEIIPKTVGTVYASSMAGFVGRTLSWLTWLMAPVLLLTRALTGLISHGESQGINRGELVALVSLAEQEGAIEQGESAVLSNLLSFDALEIGAVMTPRTVLQMVHRDTTIAEFVAAEGLHVHSRLPVYGENRDDVVGYVHQRDLLLAAARGEEGPVSGHTRPIIALKAKVPLGEALRVFLERGDHLALVQDGFGGTAGLVTLEDVVETLLGAEIVDEADEVVDLRKLAADIRDKRMSRKQAVVVPPNEA